jgi:hypothetical protein
MVWCVVLDERPSNRGKFWVNNAVKRAAYDPYFCKTTVDHVLKFNIKLPSYIALISIIKEILKLKMFIKGEGQLTKGKGQLRTGKGQLRTGKGQLRTGKG